MGWVGLVKILGEKYRENCVGEIGTRMHVLGRRTGKCGIILKCKKYKMRAWTGFMWHKTERVEAFYSTLR
jgi:hypothetical protein